MSVFRVVFLGTPDFAAKHLQTLLDDDHYQVVGVVTQPDRPQGRKMLLTPSPVKELALKNNLEVLTPENLRKEPEVLEKIKSWKAEVAVVVAFGQILSQEFLDSFNFGAVNVHGSLLPLWRGAAPIQRSIQAGDTETGVALQRMVKKLDAGPVIGVRKVQLDTKITATELYDKLAVLGCELLHVELMDYLRGHLAPVAQDESRVTVAPKIEKEESLIDFTSETAWQIHNKVRAFTMGPGTYFMFAGKRLKVHETEVVEQETTYEPGMVTQVSADGIAVQTKQGQLKLLSVQPESKPRMPVREFLKANKVDVGGRFSGGWGSP